MNKELFVIEAPGKIKSFKGLLAQLDIHAEVQATGGHLYNFSQDLNVLGIDEKFQEIGRELRSDKAVFFLRKAAREADKIYVATDADEEGDGIAWDVHELVKDLCPNILRVKLRGMDKDSISEALENAYPVSKLEAAPSRTRAMVDRLIGHSFSKDGVGVGRVSSGLLGLIHKSDGNITATRVKLTAPSTDGDAPWIAYFDTNKLVSKSTADKLASLPFPALKMTQKGMPSNAALNMGDIMVKASDDLGMTPKETAKSLQNLYETGQMSYPRAGSRGVSKAAQRKLKRLMKKSGYKSDAEKVREKEASEVHDAPYPMGDVDISKNPEKLGDDAGVKTIVARHYVKKGLNRHAEKAGTKVIFDFLIRENFSKEIATFIAKLNWTRELGPRVPGEKTFVDSEVIERMPEAALMEKAVKMNLGRPSTWANHIETFCERGLTDDDLQLTDKGRKWVQSTPAPLLDPRLSGKIEAACSAVLPAMETSMDREPWEILAEAIVEKLPEELKSQMRENLSPERPDHEASYAKDIERADPVLQGQDIVLGEADLKVKQ